MIFMAIMYAFPRRERNRIARVSDAEVAEYTLENPERREFLRTMGRYAKVGGVVLLAGANVGCPFCDDGNGDGGGNGGGTGPSNMYKLNLSLYDTFTRNPISGFNYNVGTGDKTAQGNQVIEIVNGGSSKWKFSGGGLEIPREVNTSVSKDLTLDILAIAKDTGFPTEHYRTIVPIGRDAGDTFRFMTDDLNIYAVATDRGGQVQNATPVVSELYGRLNPKYGGLAGEIPSEDRIAAGDIFVRTVDSIGRTPDGREISGTVNYHFLRPSILKWVEVQALPRLNENGLRHELARALGFRGNGATDRSSIFYIVAEFLPMHPNWADRKSAELAYNRSGFHYLDSSRDTDTL